MNALKVILFPVSILYGTITWLRNKFFDWGILPSQVFGHPVISVGNLSMGGTGKTPHIEYLISLLKNNFPVAVLSRGYKRKSRGYQVVNRHSDVSHAGDEPLQISRKHPDARVAVCADRRHGIKTILKESPHPKVILLDDAFQHRYVKPGLNILLTDYHKIFTRNYVVPTGNLREFRSGASRADALVVTKTPLIFSPLDRKLILDELSKYNVGKIFFSYVKYGDWMPMTDSALNTPRQRAKTIFLLTGIANPTPLAEHLKRQCCDLKVFNYSDHHQFTEHELYLLIKKYNETYSGDKVIVTTEKDSMRLYDSARSGQLKDIPVYYVPIEIEFHNGDKESFDKMIFEFMHKYYPEGKPEKLPVAKEPKGLRKKKK